MSKIHKSDTRKESQSLCGGNMVAKSDSKVRRAWQLENKLVVLCPVSPVQTSIKLIKEFRELLSPQTSTVDEVLLSRQENQGEGWFSMMVNSKIHLKFQAKVYEE